MVEVEVLDLTTDADTAQEVDEHLAAPVHVLDWIGFV